MNIMNIHRIALSLALAATAPLAAAHTGADAGAHHGFVAGVLHPFTGLDHLAAMLAVGLWSALICARWQDAVKAPLSFAGMLLIGALAGAFGLVLPAVEPMIATSLLALGLLLAARQTLPAPAAMGLVALFALFHGAAHGQELAGAGALAGMVLATALLHGAGLALGLVLRTRSVWWPRLAGAATALFGAALLLA
jgi:urease accessory protein